MDPVTPILSLDSHSFYVGPLSPGVDNELPTSLPFRLGIHPQYAIPRLLMDSATSLALDRAYSVGSMASTPLGESPLAVSRMDEMLGGLSTALGRGLSGCRVLEIGAGAGGLMRAMRELGADVTGVEIGPQGRLAAERFGLRMIDRPFTPGLFDERFDVICSYGCVEHLADLETFFAASRASLHQDGLMFHVVPNAEPFFEAGNLGHLTHEHVNYFSARNGVRLLTAQGFRAVESATFRAGNELMLWGRFDESRAPSWPCGAVALETETLERYACRLYERTSRVQANLEALFSGGATVGFYAGGSEFGFRMTDRAIRYFDGDVFKHGLAWLTGLPTIEAPEALVAAPVDHLVIFKPHHFAAIVERLQTLGLATTRFWNVASFGEEGFTTVQ